MKMYEKMMTQGEVRKLEKPQEVVFFLRERSMLTQKWEKDSYSKRVTIIVHGEKLPLRNRLRAAAQLIKACFAQVLEALRNG